MFAPKSEEEEKMSILKQLSKKREGQKGFTLIELLIVVAILGILAAVIIPNVSSFMKTGTLNAANTEKENVKTAAMAFFAENGVWPDSATENLTSYITGSLRSNYVFNDDGLITGVNNSGVTNPWGTSISWDAANYKWK